MFSWRAEMFALFLVKWIGGVVLFVFVTFSMMQALYRLADVIEAHLSIAKRFLKYSLTAIIVLYVLMLFDDDLPRKAVFVGLVAHISYCSLIPQFPYISVKSVRAIVAFAAAVISHFVWFFDILAVEVPYYSYAEISGIFIVCVWFCPIFFVVSLSTTESLPFISDQSSDSVDSFTSEPNRVRPKNMFRSLFDNAWGAVSKFLPASLAKEKNDNSLPSF